MNLKILKQFEAVVILHKLMPYKTTFTPNYKIKWDKDYEDAILEERELPEIKYYSE